MSVFLLLQAIKNRLVPALATLPLPVHGRDAKGKPKPPESGQPCAEAELVRPAAFYLGGMPPTVQDALGSVPFVVCQPMGGFDSEGLHHVRVALRLCIVGEDMEAAENDVQNLIAALRLPLIAAGCQTLEQRYQLIPDNNGQLAPWERPDEQAWPFLQAHILTTWQMQGVSYGAAI